MFELNEREAFIAMSLFLERYYQTTGGQLAVLLADIYVGPDEITGDPAAWADWLSCVAEAKRLEIQYDPSVWEAFVLRNPYVVAECPAPDDGEDAVKPLDATPRERS